MWHRFPQAVSYEMACSFSTRSLCLLQQLLRPHAKELRQRQQIGRAGIRLSGFPLGYRLPADTQRLPTNSCVILHAVRRRFNVSPNVLACSAFSCRSGSDRMYFRSALMSRNTTYASAAHTGTDSRKRMIVVFIVMPSFSAASITNRSRLRQQLSRNPSVKRHVPYIEVPCMLHGCTHFYMKK